MSGSDEHIRECVLSGRADIGISRLPLDSKLFDWMPLATAHNVCVFRPDHRFSALPCVKAVDLIGEAIIDIDPQFSAHQMNINALRFRGAEPNIAIEYDSGGHDVGFVSAGLGVSITNDLIAREYAQFNVEVRPFEPSALYHYVALWQKDRGLSWLLNAVAEALVSIISQNDCG
jgi:DNA-binding transcriptional LysR family regulator